MQPQVSLRDVSVVFPLFERPAMMLTNRLVKGRHQPRTGSFRALDGLTLDVMPGERVGLLGPNGAGKSTFLRTVGGIYAPHSGRIDVRGDVRCLFQIGAGLNEDATGYENIPLLAAANRIPLARLPELTADIEAFSELGEALDRPLRTYSSGMRLRIAFAVATSMHSDVLLMDEVIGVGDRDFREKAKKRIERMMEGAGTLILASHSEAYLRSYCHRGLVFERGRIVLDAPIEDAIARVNGRDRAARHRPPEAGPAPPPRRLRVTPWFKDGVVLQQGRPHRVWGACSGEGDVFLRCGDREWRASVVNGRWELDFGPLPVGGPHTIELGVGDERRVVSDVLVGDVWIVAGQDNAFEAADGVLDEKVREFTGFGPTRRFSYPAEMFEELMARRARWQSGACQAGALGSSFGNALAASTGGFAGVMRAACPGTAIQSWYNASAPAVAAAAEWTRREKPGALADDWVYPLHPMPIRGVVWWQGESNVAASEEYRRHLEALIREWREWWNDPDLPFVIVGLQNIRDEPEWRIEQMRQAQRQVADADPHCHFVPTADLTPSGDLHPAREEIAAIGRRAAEVLIRETACRPAS